MRLESSYIAHSRPNMPFHCMTLEHMYTHDCIGRCLLRIRIAIPTQCSLAGQQEVMQERTAAVKLFLTLPDHLLPPLPFVCSLTFRYLRQTLLRSFAACQFSRKNWRSRDL